MMLSRLHVLNAFKFRIFSVYDGFYWDITPPQVVEGLHMEGPEAQRDQENRWS